MTARRMMTMMTISKLFVAALHALVLCAVCAAQQAEPKGVKALAEEAGRAFVVGDFKRLVELTYPKVVENVGGREKMVAMLERDTREAKGQGFEMVSYVVGEPREPVRGGSQLFVIVPTELKMKATDGVWASKSYLVGISDDDGKNWTFIDGAFLDDAKVKLVIPAAVGKLVLPKPAAPVLEKKGQN